MTSLVCLALCSAALAAPGPPEPGDDLPGITAVQNRPQFRRHEFTAWVGTLPLDAFEKGLTFSGAYTVRLHDLVSWEVAQFTYSYGIETRLADELAALETPLGPTPFETVNYHLMSNVVFTPFYGKSAVLNRTLIRHEAFLLAGAGVGWLTLTTRPAVDVGIGWRLYAGDRVSFRLDGRNLTFFARNDVHNELWLGLGVSVAVGR
jgi:outer membrane beta-barrel protein